MGRSSHTRTEIAARRERVAALYLQGKSQYAIGRELGLTQTNVSRDLDAIRQVWLANAVRDYGERQAEELAKCDRLEAEAWEAWERSKQPAETTTAERVTLDGTDRTKAAKRTEGRDGNPTFLTVVERCIAKRCEILGLDAPKKHHFVQLPDLSHLKPDDIDRILNALDPLFAPRALAGRAPGEGAPVPAE